MTAFDWNTTGPQRLTVDGKSLELACWGPPPREAPSIVVLHEGLGSLAQWKDLPARLAEVTGFGVLAYSRAGYGGSDPVPLPRPLDYMTREAEDVLGPLLDAAGIGRCILLGHSDGASIAAIYAGSVSDLRVRGLILIAPHFFTEPTGLATIAEAGSRFANGDLREGLAKYHADPEATFHGWHGAWTDPAFAAWNVADAIDHWRVPVLAIQGDADPYGTLAQIEEIERRIYAPLDQLILPGCGHAPHQSHPGPVIAAITEFCARLERLEQQEVALV